MTFLKNRLAAERSRFAESMNEGGGTLLIDGAGTAYFHWLPTLTNAPVHAVRGARQLQVRTDPFIDFRGVSLDPPKDGGVIDVEPALAIDLFDVTGERADTCNTI